jgi:hypothetical protein
MSSANRTENTSPSKPWMNSPTQNCAVVVDSAPRASSPLVVGQLRLGSPMPRKNSPKTVARCVAANPAMSDPANQWVVIHTRQSAMMGDKLGRTSAPGRDSN